MKKRIIAYKERIDACLSGEIKVDDWQKLLEEHAIYTDVTDRGLEFPKPSRVLSEFRIEFL